MTPEIFKQLTSRMTTDASSGRPLMNVVEEAFGKHTNITFAAKLLMLCQTNQCVRDEVMQLPNGHELLTAIDKVNERVTYLGQGFQQSIRENQIGSLVAHHRQRIP